MLIDRTSLVGKGAALLAPGTSSRNLVIAGRGQTESIPDGTRITIDGVRLTIEGTALSELFGTQDEPWLRFEAIKEVAPGVRVDPFAHRRTLLAGAMDLRQGTHTNTRVVEIDGIDTLATVERGSASWVSEKYELVSPATFGPVWWELEPSRHATGFEYSIAVDVWESPNETAPSATVDLTGGSLSAKDLRAEPEPNWPGEVVAFRVRLAAEVAVDSPFRGEERAAGGRQTASVGQPLLQSIVLAEPILSAYYYHSLGELIPDPRRALLLPPDAPTTLSVVVDLAASLEEGESLAVIVGNGEPGEPRPGGLSRFEAAMVGTVSRRPSIPRAS